MFRLRPQHAIWLMFGLQLLAAAALALAFPMQPDDSFSSRHVAILAADAVTVGGICLAALWAAIGPGSLVVRGLTAVLLAATMVLGQLAFWRAIDFDEFNLLLMAFVWLTAWMLIIVSFGLLGWIQGLGIRSVDQGAAGAGKSQFHLWHLLAALTIAGLLMGGARFLLAPSNQSEPPEWGLESVELGWVLLIVFVMVALQVTAAVAAMISALAVRWHVRLTVVALALVGLVTWWEPSLLTLLEQHFIPASDYFVANLLTGLWVWLSLLILRSGGYRLTMADR